MLTEADIEGILETGRDPERVRADLRALAMGSPRIDVDRPCTLGDGIERIRPGEYEALYERWARASASGRLTSFIPASGAATRLGIPDTPKALVVFHHYPWGTRTAAEEQVVESAAMGARAVHFTVPDDALRRFSALSLPNVTFSVQDPATDTPALAEDGTPFRVEGRLLFRPGGHGALLANLGGLGADLVLIKNVDNVVSDSERKPILTWRRRLVGMLVRLEEQVHAVLREARAGGDVAERTRSLVGKALRTRDEVEEALNRPIRVCGMIPNTGDPGGGPFWVRGTRQILEGAQVSPELVRAGTHFHPVDLVCALRDVDGQQHDLARFADPSAFMVVDKTHDGRRLKALELPGLWNGGMAGWLTSFVEMPPDTFSPVKTPEDLEARRAVRS